jgi:hypothetical protein
VAAQLRQQGGAQAFAVGLAVGVGHFERGFVAAHASRVCARLRPAAPTSSSQ